MKTKASGKKSVKAGGGADGKAAASSGKAAASNGKRGSGGGPAVATKAGKAKAVLAVATKAGKAKSEQAAEKRAGKAKSEQAAEKRAGKAKSEQAADKKAGKSKSEQGADKKAGRAKSRQAADKAGKGSRFQGRRERLVSALKQHDLDALLVSTAENRCYLSGFSGSYGWLVVDRAAQAVLATDGRYWAQVESTCPEVELVRFVPARDKRIGRVLGEWLKKSKIRRLGFESRNLTVADLEDLKDDVKRAGAKVKLTGVDGLVDVLRQVKDPQEVEKLRRVAAVADRAFLRALKVLKVGIRESEFCAELEHQLQKEGARKPSFDSIVASGPNGAYPHAGVTSRRIQAGELITVDFGAQLDGYCSDITRTIWLGELPAEQARLYQVVREAQQAALAVIRPGKRCGQVDRAARKVIEQAGFGEAFSHGLGHGLGLAVHELPRLRPKVDTELEEGMVVTVEPGIYLPGVGGCRVEDSVVVTRDGFEFLTRSPYQEKGPHPLG